MSENIEKVVPDSIRTRIDVKAETIISFENGLSSIRDGKIEGISINSDTKLFIYSKLGTVTGEILNYKENDFSNSLVSLNEILLKSRNIEFAELETQFENPLYVNNCSILILKDALVVPYESTSSSFNVPILYLFADQIYGFSYGVRR